MGYAGESVETYRDHVLKALDFEPDIVIDDGCDLVSMLNLEYPEIADGVIGSTE